MILHVKKKIVSICCNIYSVLQLLEFLNRKILFSDTELWSTVMVQFSFVLFFSQTKQSEYDACMFSSLYHTDGKGEQD